METYTGYVGHKWVGVSGLECGKTFMTAVLDSKATQELPLTWKYPLSKCHTE